MDSFTVIGLLCSGWLLGILTMLMIVRRIGAAEKRRGKQIMQTCPVCKGMCSSWAFKKYKHCEACERHRRWSQIEKKAGPFL